MLATCHSISPWASTRKNNLNHWKVAAPHRLPHLLPHRRFESSLMLASSPCEAVSPSRGLLFNTYGYRTLWDNGAIACGVSPFLSSYPRYSHRRCFLRPSTRFARPSPLSYSAPSSVVGSMVTIGCVLF